MIRTARKPVTQNALVKRIRRALKHWNWHLKIIKKKEAEREVGRYCLADSNGNIKDRYSSLVNLANDLGVLRVGEEVKSKGNDDQDLDFSTGVQVTFFGNVKKSEHYNN